MFPFLHDYPYSDLHEIDLAYMQMLVAAIEGNNKQLLAWKATHEKEYEELSEKVEGLINNLVDVVVPWDSSVAYHIFTIVEYHGTNYIAVQDVPVGTMITNTDYWQPANTVVEQINAIGATVSELENTIDDMTEGSSCNIHMFSGKGDTSYIIIKLDKNKYKMDFHNCEADSYGTYQSVSTPLEYLKRNLNYDLVTNCNYAGADYPGRLAGVNHTGTVNTRQLFCFNSETENINIMPAGTDITSVPAEYDTVFAISDTLVRNGVKEEIADEGDFEPRNCFGWNDNEFIILITEGRGNHEKGLRLNQCAEIMYNAGAKNAYNFDGGGSVCLAVNYYGSAVKINKYRDPENMMPELRPVALAQGYKRR